MSNIKLSDQQVVEIFKSIGSYRSLARHYGVSHMTIFAIKKRCAWQVLTRDIESCDFRTPRLAELAG